MIKHGYFYWNERRTHKPAEFRKFYKDTLGWTFKDMPMPDGSSYALIVDGDQNIGGLMDLSQSPEHKDVPEGWCAFIAVDDVDARFAKAEEAGCKVLAPPFDVPGVGRIAMLMEPGGAEIGWMTPPDME